MDSVDKEWWLNHTGEYVLGLLDEQDRLVLERVMEHEPDIVNMVAQWRAQLQPLTDALNPIEPPAYIHDALFEQLPQRTRKLNPGQSADNNDTSEHAGTVNAESDGVITDGASVMQLLRTKQGQTDGWRSFAGIVTVACVFMGIYLYGFR